jgi:hypothetical protein
LSSFLGKSKCLRINLTHRLMCVQNIRSGWQTQGNQWGPSQDRQTLCHCWTHCPL